jgi:hypothetical protein
MPDELSQDLDQFDLLAVDFARDARIPVIADLGKLGCEAEVLHGM